MSNATTTSIIPTEFLATVFAEYKEFTKAVAIIRSISAIVSVISSVSLIRMITTSKQRLSTTYHRILLGMSIADIVYSLAFATFQAMSPSEMDYMVWNAQGNQVSCDVQGVASSVGAALTLLYSCSLNIYYLFKVKYNKTDRYIRTKIEPYLHGFPILFAILYIIHNLIRGNYNDPGTGTCGTDPLYEPPHCLGYEDGEVREGFTIPCGRGRGGATVYNIVYLFLTLAPPVIISVSLGMLYVSVRKQETSMSRFGAGSLDVNAQSNTNRDNSRAVLHKAIAYTTAYWLSWGWTVCGFIMITAGIDIPLWYVYLWVIFSPLEGFFNLCIFIHPKVVAAKRRGQRGSNISWCQALGTVFWSGLVGGNSASSRQPNNPVRNVGERNNCKRGENVENDPVAASSTLASTNPSRSLANPGIDVQLSSTHEGGNGDITGEKTESQVPVGTDDNFDENHRQSP